MAPNLKKSACLKNTLKTFLYGNFHIGSVRQETDIQQLYQVFLYGIRFCRFCTCKVMPQKQVVLWIQSCREHFQDDHSFIRYIQNCTSDCKYPGEFWFLGRSISKWVPSSLALLRRKQRRGGPHLSKICNWMDE